MPQPTRRSEEVETRGLSIPEDGASGTQLRGSRQGTLGHRRSISTLESLPRGSRSRDQCDHRSQEPHNLPHHQDLGTKTSAMVPRPRYVQIQDSLQERFGKRARRRNEPPRRLHEGRTETWRAGDG